MSGSFGGWISKNSPIPITKKPDLNDPVLRAKLAKGMGHNYYGEPAWPNNLLYIFPVVILGTIAGFFLESCHDRALDERALQAALPFFTHAILLDRAFAHCPRFPT